MSLTTGGYGGYTGIPGMTPTKSPIYTQPANIGFNPLTGSAGGAQADGLMGAPKPNYNFQMQAGPTPGMTASAAPKTQFQIAPNPTSSSTYTPAGATQFQVNPNPTPSSTYAPAGDTAPAAPNPSTPANGGLNTQYATLDNLQPYMNPYLDQIINKGNHAIENSAAARGGLLSSRTPQDIGDWTTGATSQAYNDARTAFNSDRNYMTDQFNNQRNFDYNNYKDTNAQNWDVFKYGDASQKGQLSDYYNQMNGITNTGLNASANSGNIQSNLMNALAQLYGNRGDVNAQGAINNGNNNGGLMSSLIGLLPMLLGA